MADGLSNNISFYKLFEQGRNMGFILMTWDPSRMETFD